MMAKHADTCFMDALIMLNSFRLGYFRQNLSTVRSLAGSKKRVVADKGNTLQVIHPFHLRNGIHYKLTVEEFHFFNRTLNLLQKVHNLQLIYFRMFWVQIRKALQPRTSRSKSWQQVQRHTRLVRTIDDQLFQLVQPEALADNPRRKLHRLQCQPLQLRRRSQHPHQRRNAHPAPLQLKIVQPTTHPRPPQLNGLNPGRTQQYGPCRNIHTEEPIQRGRLGQLEPDLAHETGILVHGRFQVGAGLANLLQRWNVQVLENLRPNFGRKHDDETRQG
uniref:(northern house mosquito) hypothetical protein n=2 Tax=Culex pipiens TaxID=7175 RepID=A0A8D8BMP3_CULPI